VRRWIGIVLTLAMILLNSSVGEAAASITIDSETAPQGIVKVAAPAGKAKTKVLVEKGNQKYYYDLKDREDIFPLQLGSGEYRVAVLEQTTGNNYRVIKRETFRAELLEEKQVYLQASQPVKWNSNQAGIKLAQDLTENLKTDREKIKVIYDYLVKNMKYDSDKINRLEVDYLPDIDLVLQEKKGICYDYAVLFAAMARSCGIPTKLVKGYKDDITAYHAWNEVYLDGGWRIIDTTYDSWAYNNGTGYEMFKSSYLYEKSREY
jgi:transglutaminase-like putative cysteine protease